MKVTIEENEGCYAIKLIPETQKEVVELVRFGMNRTNEIRSANTHAFQDGEVRTKIVFGKSRRADSNIPRRK